MAYPWRLFFVSFTLYFLVQGGVEAIRHDPIFTGTESSWMRCLRSPWHCPHSEIPPPHPPASSPTSYAPIQPPPEYSYPAPIIPVGAPLSSPKYAHGSHHLHEIPPLHPSIQAPTSFPKYAHGIPPLHEIPPLHPSIQEPTSSPKYAPVQQAPIAPSLV